LAISIFVKSGYFEHYAPPFLLFGFMLFLNEANFRLVVTISDNLIEELPASVCNLSHLKSLCLDNNNVKQVLAGLTQRRILS
jgi:hypothetical protein